MENNSSNSKFFFQFSISIIGWFAVFLQLFLIIENRVASVPETVIRFFSFFTVLTNILVAICFSILILKPKSNLGIFFSNPKNMTAVTLYILIVGIVYNAILRFLWVPEGFQKVADEILHLVIPILVLVYWIKFIDKKYLNFQNILPWLIFPSIYLVYTLIRGHFYLYYPYPFLDVIQLGYNSVFINCFFMVMAFFIVGSLLIMYARFKSK